MKIKEGSYNRIKQLFLPFYYFPEGGVRTLGVFTDLTHLNIHGIPKLSYIGMQGAPSYYNVHLKDEFMYSLSLFSDREVEILKYVAKGFKSEDIAKQFNRSIFTIRNHRKNILHKSGCTNL